MIKRWNELDPRLKQNDAKRHDYLAEEIEKRGEGVGVEEDPVFSRSVASRIADSDVSNWSKKYDKVELRNNYLIFYNNDVEEKRIDLSTSFSTKSSTEESIRTALESITELYCLVVDVLPRVGNKDTFYLKKSEGDYTYDIYFYEYQGDTPVNWCHVGGSNVSEDYVKSLVSNKADKADFKTINNNSIFKTGEKTNLTPSDIGVPTKISQLDNDNNYIRMGDAAIRVEQTEDKDNYKYIISQGNRGQVHEEIVLPKLKIAKAETVTNPEGHPEGEYLHLKFSNGDEVYIPTNHIVGAVYNGMKRQFQEGESAEKLGTYLNNIDINIANAIISGNFNTSPSDKEIQEYKAKNKGADFPYETTKQFHDAVTAAITDKFEEISKKSEDELKKDEFLLQLNNALSAIATAAAIVGVGLNMTCVSIKKHINDVFDEEDDGEGNKKYKFKDDNFSVKKQDKLIDRKTAGIGDILNLKTISTATGEESFIDDVSAENHSIQLSFEDIKDQPTMLGQNFKKDMDPREYGLQVRLVADDNSGIFLKNQKDGDGNVIRTYISTYAPDMETIVEDGGKLKIARKGITDDHCAESSITGRAIARGTIQGGSTINEEGVEVPTGHIALNTISSGNIMSYTIRSEHIAQNTIKGSNIANEQIKGGSALVQGHIAQGTIQGYNIKNNQITENHLTDETINKLKNEVYNINLGQLRDTSGQGSVDHPVNSYHFTDEYVEKLGNLKVFNNDLINNVNDPPLYFVRDGDNYKITLDPKFKSDLVRKANDLEEEYRHLKDSFDAFKEQVQSDFDKIKIQSPIYPDLQNSFVEVGDERLCFNKQGEFVAITGTITNTQPVNLECVIANIPNELIPARNIKYEVQTMMSDVPVLLKLKVNGNTLSVYSAILEDIPMPTLVESTEIPINIVYACRDVI